VTDTPNPELATASAPGPILAGADFSNLAALATSEVPQNALERSLSAVTPSDAAAEKSDQATFQFRSLLTSEQLAQLQQNAPGVAEQMLTDFNAILSFGQPVMEKLNQVSVQLLNDQKGIAVPEAEQIVNDMLREIDGFNKKYRNPKIEEGLQKLTNFLRGVKYSLKTMVRETKPISEKIDLAEVSLKGMEQDLADNVSRAQKLRETVTTTLGEVATVLAALEEIQEQARGMFAEVDGLVKAHTAADGKSQVGEIAYRGRTISLQELTELQAQYATGVTQLEKTWFDWRQQFFLGYAQAPSVRNLILVTLDMQRRCQSLRTMGLPAARSSLAMAQQAALAKEGAEMGEAVTEGVNKLVQNAFDSTAETVAQVAQAAQTPILSEETVFKAIDSVKQQCEALVAADKWGRDLRARNVRALEQGEQAIHATFTGSRRQLVEQALNGVAPAEASAPGSAGGDILGTLGVTGR
jgi:uncharacterized protein YaaN involved in tellurite resistance